MYWTLSPNTGKRRFIGTYETTFNGLMLNSGVYFYRMTVSSFSETKKLVLIK